MKAIDPHINLYNPATIPKSQFVEETIGRPDLFEALIQEIRDSTPGSPPQHQLLIGPRGMGKTSSLLMIKYRVEEDPDLSGEWIPVLFDEEEYGIGDLADFWLEVLRLFESAGSVPAGTADELLKENPPDLEIRARQEFLDALSISGKRAILLIDNLNDILGALDEDGEHHRLRGFLMESDRVLVIGTAASYFAGIEEHEAPFFEFFRTRRLDRFGDDEMKSILWQLADLRDDDGIKEVLEKQPARLRSLRILTGGNPRLMKMVYSILREGIDTDARQDLQRLLEECTPFFKHRIETLPKQARRVFDHLARHWDPVTTGDLTVPLRKASNYISAQLKRLIEEGFVEDAGGTGKRRLYQVSERLYNIYYLMRYSRDNRNRLRWLTGFMRVLYTLPDYEAWLEKMSGRLAAGDATLDRDEGFGYLASLASATDDAGMKRQIYQRTLDTAARSGDYEKAAQMFDQADFRSALEEEEVDILEVFEGLDPEKQREYGYQPETADWWIHLSVYAYEAKAYRVVRASCQKAIEIDPKNLGGWTLLGCIIEEHFGDHKKARKAYEKAIEIDPKFALPRQLLGSLLTEHFGEYEEARKAYEKAIELNPKNAPSFYDLGRLSAYYIGNWDEARKAYENAIKLDPKFALPRCALADLLFDYEEPDEGRDQLIIGLSLDPDYGFAQQLFLEKLGTNREAWHDLLPSVLEAVNPDEALGDQVLAFLIEGTTRLLQGNDPSVVHELFDSAGGTSRIEPLMLALRALDDESVLEAVSPELREVTRDVMAKIRPAD